MSLDHFLLRIIMSFVKIFVTKVHSWTHKGIGDWGLGIGDWGLGIGDWGTGDWGDGENGTSTTEGSGD